MAKYILNVQLLNLLNSIIAKLPADYCKLVESDHYQGLINPLVSKLVVRQVFVLVGLIELVDPLYQEGLVVFVVVEHVEVNQRIELRMEYSKLIFSD